MTRTAAVALLALLALACAPPPSGGEGEGEGDAGEGEGEGDAGDGEGEGDAGEGEGDAGEGEGEGEAVVDVVISEVGCAGVEFVEVEVVGGVDVDVARVAVVDDNFHAFVGDGVVAAGGRAVLAAEDGLTHLSCGRDRLTLLVDGVPVGGVVSTPLLPGGATAGVLPGQSGLVANTPTPGAPNAAYEDASDALFLGRDAAVPAALPVLRVAIADAGLTSLRADGGVFVDAAVSFAVDGVVIGAAPGRARIKGQSVLRTLDQKPAWKLRFSGDDHLLGVQHLVVNNLVQDNSASRERVYYDVARSQGLAAPRAGYVRVFVNDVDYGVGLVLEDVDDDGFLARHFQTSAALYEGEYGQDLFVGNEGQFDHDFGVDDVAGRARLRAIAAALDAAAASPAGLREDTASFIDWDEVVAFFAVDIACGHWDSYGATKNNFTFHLDDAGVLRLIESGADQAFTEVVSADTLTSRLGLLCVADAGCAAALDAAVFDVRADVDAWVNGGGAARLRADAEALRVHMTSDPRREWDPSQIAPLVDDIIAALGGG